MRILVSGGTGFIGKALLNKLLEKGLEAVLLTRNPERIKSLAGDHVTVAAWDGASVGEWADHLNGTEAVVNLAGEPVVGKRWNDVQKERILKSRIEATRTLISVIAQSTRKPKVLVNASAVGFYGHVENGDVTESHPKGSGFLSDVSAQWEGEALVAERYGVRVVLLRTGVVLEKDGGALQKMIPPFQFFWGGPLGTGRQWVPWVHRDDVIGAILFALEHPELKGPINATAPNPVTMKEFCRSLGKVMKRPSWVPVPTFLVRLLLGESSELLLTGQRALPEKLEASGYSFRYPKLEDALSAILKK